MRSANVSECCYSSKEALFVELREKIVEAIKGGLRGQDRFVLGLSGGPTPGPLLAALSKEELEWDRVDVHLVDERWISLGSEASNEKMVRGIFMQNQAAAARLVGLPDRDLSTREAVRSHHRRIGGDRLKFDLTILGMGEDGHVASLFPGDPDSELSLARKNREIYCATRAPSGCRDRVSLTYEGILDSASICLLITGDSNRSLYSRRVSQDRADWLPVHYFMKQREVPLTVYWAP
jgi:6-phosphogluconolactonase